MDAEGEGEDVTIPADDVARVVGVVVERVAISSSDKDGVRNAVRVGDEFLRCAKIALRVGGVLEDLSVFVSVSLGDSDRAERLDGQHSDG